MSLRYTLYFYNNVVVLVFVPRALGQSIPACTVHVGIFSHGCKPVSTHTHTHMFAAARPVNNDPPSSPTQNTMQTLQITWSPPPNDQVTFLVGYQVQFTVSSVSTKRRRRQADAPFVRNVPGRSFSIGSPDPYSNYNFDVFLRYQPPGSSSDLLRRLLAPFTFISAERGESLSLSLSLSLSF